MVKAIRIHEHGGPDVMKWEDITLPPPGSGEARVRHTAIGLNFIDIYQRAGLYATRLPHALGSEAAGIVEATGPDVTDLAPGDRVAYVSASRGAYSEARIIKATELMKLPQAIRDDQAAGMMLKGLTAWYLLRKSYEVKNGDTILFHAAAGGVGLIAVQWAKHLGATVIGTVGTQEKAVLARQHGCDHVIVASQEDIVERVGQLTQGRKLPVAYDSVGKNTFFASLDCLRPHGVMVSFGNSSGPVEPFSLMELMKRGSLYVTRPSLFHFISERSALERAAGELFALVSRGVIRIEINQTYPLRDVSRAHADLEARKTTGSTVLLP